MAASWIASGVMQTGQPGPETISTPASSSLGLRPDLWRAIVWVPQTSMIRTGEGRAAASFRTSSSRLSIVRLSLGALMTPARFRPFPFP